MQPLTHHEILELIGPFTRRGRHVDLGSSDRLRRCLKFKPHDHPADGGLSSIREVLVLEGLEMATHRLTRVLTLPNGLEARLETEGRDPGELLDRLQSIPPHRQLRAGDGFVMAWSHRLETAGAGAADCRLIFQRGVAQVAGLILTLDGSTVKSGRAPVKVIMVGDRYALPEDALAVLGRQWSRIRASTEGWTGYFLMRAREPKRSHHAEAALEVAAGHLARLLGDTPSRFHDRWRAARWRVFFRRLTPVAACAGLILCAAAVPKLHLAEGSGLRMLILNSPPILMILFFCMREVPLIEIPPVPRRTAAPSWRERA